jgi:hypothetical protein
MPNVPNTTSNGLILTSVGDGTNASRWQAGTASSGSGITQLTGDVTAGPGSGSVASTVAQLQGTTLSASGSYAPTAGQVLAYSTAIANQWLPMGGTPTAGSQLYWNGVAWTSSVAPTANAQFLIWNSSTSTWVPKSMSQDVSITNAGVTNVDKLQNTTLSVSSSYAPSNGQILAYGTAVTPQWNPMGGTPTTGSVLWWNGIAWTSTTPTTGFLYWNGSTYSYTTAGGGTTNQAWAVTNQNPGLTLNASTLYTPSGWTITASGFSNYLVQISCTVRMTTATAGTCSIGIQVGGSLFGATSGVTYGGLNAQSVTVTGSYLLSSVSGTQVIQGQVTSGASAGLFYNGNMTVIGIS